MEHFADFAARISAAAAAASSEWGISHYAEDRTPHGLAFGGDLTRHGTRVGFFNDRGDGGAMTIVFTDRGASAAFDAEAERLFPGEFEAMATLVLALLERAGV